jgi:hypothetical protein
MSAMPNVVPGLTKAAILLVAFLVAGWYGLGLAAGILGLREMGAI